MGIVKSGAAALLVMSILAPLAAQASATAQLREFQSVLNATGSPVGIEIYVQPWNPLTPDVDALKSALHQPAGISSRMNAAWDLVRKGLSDPKNPNGIPALLSKGGLIAKGVNLYDVTFTTNPLSSITLQRGGGSGAPLNNAFTLHWVIPGTRLDFRSTTPDAVRGVGLSRDLDPRLSVQMDLDITLGLAVADRPGDPTLQVTDTVVRIGNPQVDSGNVSGDVIKAIADFCSQVAYGRNLNTLLAWALGDKNVAADPQHGGLNVAGVQGIDVKQIANDRLKPLNAEIANAGVANYLRVGSWAKTAGQGQMLALLFAPRAVPLPPQSGALSGTVMFDSSVSASQLPTTCNSVIGKDGVVVQVQTGPRKVLDVDPVSYGPAPIVRLQSVAFGGGPVSQGQCAFTLTGLVAAWPNDIEFPAPTLGTRGSLGNLGHYLQLKPDHWASPIALTAAVATRNLIASGSMDYKAGVGVQRNPRAAAGFVNPGDPAYNPAAMNSSWSARQDAGRQTTGDSGAAAVKGSAWGAPAPAAAAAAGAMTRSTLPASRLQKSVSAGAKATQRVTPSAAAGNAEQVAPVQQ